MAGSKMANRAATGSDVVARIALARAGYKVHAEGLFTHDGEVHAEGLFTHDGGPVRGEEGVEAIEKT